jgi:hypothetical protein
VRSQTATIITIAIAAALVCAQSSAAAEAPLLSGYGGPGAGEQQIIGSGLVNGGGASHGGTETPASGSLSEGESGVSGSGSSTAGRQPGANTSGHAQAGASKGGSGGRAGKGSRSGGGHGAAAVPGGGSSPPPSSPASATTAGLSGSQVLLVAAIAIALALIAGLTWRLGRRERSDGAGRPGPGAREIRGAGS